MNMMNEVVKDIYIGDREDAALDGDDFDSVVTLTDETHPSTTDHHPLVDGDNETEAFAAAVNAVRGRLESNGRVLVHCNLGVSRSASVLATALAAERGMRYEEALALIREKRPAVNPAPELTTLARTYLGEDERPFSLVEE